MATDQAQMAEAKTDDASSTVELIARYRGGPAALREAVGGMTVEQLLAYPVEGKMSTQEVVCHIADCDQFLADRIKRTVAMERPLLMGVDGWPYLDALRYAERDVELDLRLLEVTREQMAADLERLPADAWERVGVHSEVGLVSVREILLHTIRHLEGHLEAIAEKRQAMGLA